MSADARVRSAEASFATATVFVACSCSASSDCLGSVGDLIKSSTRHPRVSAERAHPFTDILRSSVAACTDDILFDDEYESWSSAVDLEASSSVERPQHAIIALTFWQYSRSMVAI